ncbi:MAG: polysaccharide deacetylase family protein [Hyphomicrobiales bacterium]
MTLRYLGYKFALNLLSASNLHKPLARLKPARGIILAAHRVRPFRGGPFLPNRSLEITPDFLGDALRLVRSRGYEFVNMDEALRRLRNNDPRRFAVLTFDDGYRDHADYALPVMQALNVPATFYIAPGFAERSAALWWADVEAVLARNDMVAYDHPRRAIRLRTRSVRQKQAAFEQIYREIRDLSWQDAKAVTTQLAKDYRINSAETVESACLDWDGVRALAADSFVTIGAHTVNHPVLAACQDSTINDEMRQSRAMIVNQLQRPVRHLAYPHGDPTAAGQREFETAREIGFDSAVTTRPGLVDHHHADRLTALPRISLNGCFQSLAQLDVLISGAPFLIRNAVRPRMAGPR